MTLRRNVEFPWLDAKFPDLEKKKFLPDFSLTVATLLADIQYFQENAKTFTQLVQFTMIDLPTAGAIIIQGQTYQNENIVIWW